MNHMLLQNTERGEERVNTKIWWADLMAVPAAVRSRDAAVTSPATNAHMGSEIANSLTVMSIV